LTQAAGTFRASSDAVGEAAALGAIGDLELQRAMPVAAESAYARGIARLAGRPAPDVAWRLHAGLGAARRSRGALADAAHALRAAVAEVERVAGGLRVEERRAGFLADKWDVYAQLVLTELARGRQADAFGVSERMRARQMVDLLARGRIAPTVAAADAGAAAREEDLRRRITELTRLVEGTTQGAAPLRGSTPAALSVDAASEALDAAQKAYAELLLEMRESHPSYARLVSGEVVSWREITSWLRTDEAVLEYLITDSTCVVFIVTTDGVTALDLNVDRRTLARLVDFARGTMARPARAFPGAMWRAPLRRLRQYLIDPAEASGALAGKRGLIIVPHGELHYVPFAALLGPAAAERFLVEHYRVSYAPSASAWVQLARRQAPRASRGVLVLAPRPSALPGSRAEAEAIRSIYGSQATVLLGAAASERAFRDAAPQHGIIHLATYGVLNKHNPLFSFVELAPQNPEDGRLEVHEVFALGLDARLLVLSACQTALGAGALADVPTGDDWVGLVRAFLHAGADNVLATLWPVEDRATASLMEQFYTQLVAGRSESDALAEAQRWALGEPALAHPFYWAAFTVTGGR
jgi:CHAT domain-containing protein